jgi:2-polyprenyl-3-methyl-5-hydroxy-6-metoxy-1,4-benzoquinol methylase
MTLRRCTKCKLLFRSPTTSAIESAEFYEKKYRQGFTTEMPSEDDLQRLIDTNFRGTTKDYSLYLSLLAALWVRPGARLLDFGCSWGYGASQLGRAGFRVKGFEISQSRCSYARKKLDVDATSNIAELEGSYDCFFSAHVIEHVPSPSDMIMLARRLLRPGGLFVAFTPNGCFARHERDYHGWHHHWGFVHPQLIDAEFFIEAVSPDVFLVASNPYEVRAISQWDSVQSLRLDLSGDELMLAFRTRNRTFGASHEHPIRSSDG